MVCLSRRFADFDVLICGLTVSLYMLIYKQLSASFRLLQKLFCETKQLRIYLQPNSFIIIDTTMRRDVFQAIADPTRRAIIALIAFQAMTPNAIAEHFDSSRQAVSKHLRILTECKLVEQEQTGREIYYTLNVKKMKEIDKWLDQFRQLWENRFNQLDKVLQTLKTQKK